MHRIYLDNAATTPLCPEARAAMEPWLASDFGNPSSLHQEGRKARAEIDHAREILSSALGCLFAEVLFTSSGTEAANLAILGAALANTNPARNRVLLSSGEHHCVLHTQSTLERLGYKVDFIPVDRIARVQLDALGNLLGPDVLLVSVMHANNELGTLQPVQEVANLAHDHGALYHCDAVQTFGTEHFKGVAELSADLATFSAHKLNGPKGTGAIYIKAGTKIKPLIVGGGQEREVRAGTENVAGIVGFAAAVCATKTRKGGPAARDAFLDRLEEGGFIAAVPDRKAILPGHAYVRLPGIDAETMLIRLDRMGVSASSGSACSSGSSEPSHVLKACGYSKQEAREGLRFSFGRSSTLEDANEAAARVLEAAKAIQGQK